MNCHHPNVSSTLLGGHVFEPVLASIYIKLDKDTESMAI